jgi:hypothetical protein
MTSEMETPEDKALDDEYQKKLADQIQAFHAPVPDFPEFPEDVLPMEEESTEEEPDES